MHPGIHSALAAVSAALLPPPKLSLSEWSDRHVMLSSEAASRPGLWTTLAYQREPLDAMAGDSPFHTIVLQWASQMGKTQLFLCALARLIAEDPCPVLIVAPDVRMAETLSKDRLAPMFRDTPILKGKVADPRARDSGSTIFHRQFHGGHVTMVGANSPAGLAMRPIRVVIVDELDRCKVTTEGDAVELASARQEWFWNFKRIYSSSPTAKGASRIERAFEESDQRFYHVPCPRCGHFQRLTWPRVEWPEGRPDLAEYRCVECEKLIAHREKAAMMDAGRWEATAESNGIAGFHLSRLYSALRSWPDMAVQWRAVHGDPERLRVFINTWLSELWDDQAQQNIDEAHLLARRENYGPTLPDGAAVLTAGVDTQDNRIEVSVYAWGAGEESWLMEHRVIPGDPAQPAVWKALDEYLLQQWAHPLIGPMPIHAACLDSGGHFTREVCAFAEERRGRRVWGVKGMGGARPVWPRHQSKAQRGRVYVVGVDPVKQTLAARLKLDEGAGLIHFPATVGLGFFEQLLSEFQRTEFRRGVPVRSWERKKGRAAEAWDTAVYALVALHGLQAHGVHADVEASRLQQLRQVGAAPEERYAVARSRWMSP